MDYRLVAIQEPDVGPFAQALSFDQTAIDRLSQWLSSTFARRAFARETNKPDDAARYNASIERIEAAVRGVIDGDLTLRMSATSCSRSSVSAMALPLASISSPMASSPS